MSRTEGLNKSELEFINLYNAMTDQGKAITRYILTHELDIPTDPADYDEYMQSIIKKMKLDL